MPNVVVTLLQLSYQRIICGEFIISQLTGSHRISAEINVDIKNLIQIANAECLNEVRQYVLHKESSLKWKYW